MRSFLRNVAALSSPFALRREIAKQLRSDMLVYFCVAVYSVVCLAVLAVSARWEQSSHANYFVQWPVLFLWFMPMIAVAFDALHCMLRFGSRRYVAYHRVFGIRRLGRLLSGMVLLMALMIFQGSFTSLKNMLPILAGGYQYDRLHADIDRLLHFGYDPWLLLYATGPSKTLLAFMEWNYSILWFVLCFSSLFFISTSPWADGIRKRYMLMFMFVWVFCGNVLAGLSLSAGPAYYGVVTGDESRFMEQLAFLSGGQARAFQEYLWQIYMSGAAGFGSGISAFPSVHVGLIAMNALFLVDRYPKFAAPAAAYTLFIMVSSVYLGWHYAIDGYVSIVVVVVAHKLLKSLEARHPKITFSPASVARSV